MRFRNYLFYLAAIVLSGCANASSSVASPGTVVPQVVQTGSVGGWKTFPVAEFGLFSTGPGHDGNVWMINYPDVMKVSMSGSESIFKLAGQPMVAYAESMTPNPDGSMYAPEQLSATSFSIARIATDGVITQFPLPGTTFPNSLVSGSDGNIWMTRNDPNRLVQPSIGRLDLAGTYTDYPADPSLYLQVIVRGSDKNVWAEVNNPRQLVRIAVMDGSFTAFSLPPDAAIGALVSGSDGGLWIPKNGPHCCPGLYRFDPITFRTTFYPTKVEPGDLVGSGVISGPNHKLYWEHAGYVIAWDLLTHRRTGHFQVPSYARRYHAMGVGPDSQIWIAGPQAVSALIIHPIVTNPASVTVVAGTSVALSVVETNSLQKVFTVVSNDSSIATVKGSGESFQVTGIKAGSTTVTVSDKIGNSLDVPVTVQ